jgi:membrane-associated protein
VDWLYLTSDQLLHIGNFLNDLITKNGQTVYVVMFVIIFCETGLVITPVLPGDSMIFAASALSARAGNELNVHLIALLLIIAAFSGDVVNYNIGRIIGPKVYRKNYRLINKKRLNRTKAFFKKYGSQTIVYGRFIPMIRTFVPFVAGISEMNYKRFLAYNFIGGSCWVLLYAYAGYFLGNLSFVKDHFQLTLLIMFIITLIPAIYAVLNIRILKKNVKHAQKNKSRQVF